jgi:hypothetical protein
MQIFVRGLDGRSCQVCVDACESVAGLKLVIQVALNLLHEVVMLHWCDHHCSHQDVCGLPAAEQLLVHGGRVLDAQSSLQHTGLSQDDTVSLLLRLKGGKGGFGALLRGQGRDGKVTTNYDACRDLNGKRIRLVNAEKKQAEWQAKAGERLEEKAAVEQLKEMARQEKREKASQVCAGGHAIITRACTGNLWPVAVYERCLAVAHLPGHSSNERAHVPGARGRSESSAAADCRGRAGCSPGCAAGSEARGCSTCGGAKAQRRGGPEGFPCQESQDVRVAGGVQQRQ